MARNQRGRLKGLTEGLQQQPWEKEGVELGTRPTQRIDGGPAVEREARRTSPECEFKVEEKHKQERARGKQREVRVVL